MKPTGKPFKPPARGELRVSHADVHRLIMAGISGRGYRVLLAVLDETIGWQRQSIVKPLGYWVLRTGIPDHLPAVFRELERTGFIRWTRGRVNMAGQRGTAGTITLQGPFWERPAEGTTPNQGTMNSPAEGTINSPGHGTTYQASHSNSKSNTPAPLAPARSAARPHLYNIEDELAVASQGKQDGHAAATGELIPGATEKPGTPTEKLNGGDVCAAWVDAWRAVKRTDPVLTGRERGFAKHIAESFGAGGADKDRLAYCLRAYLRDERTLYPDQRTLANFYAKFANEYTADYKSYLIEKREQDRDEAELQEAQRIRAARLAVEEARLAAMTPEEREAAIERKRANTWLVFAKLAAIGTDHFKMLSQFKHDTIETVKAYREALAHGYREPQTDAEMYAM
jgi:hypothetical protein